jgi:phage tail-like protein
MANLSTFNSSIATDPLRSFRFRVTFKPVATSGINSVFDSRILDATGTATTSTTTPTLTGYSSGWSGGFTSISGLQTNVQAIQYREGGYNTTVHQMPGMTTFTPVTFTRGVIYGNDQAITWMRGLFSAAAGTGLNGVAATAKGFRLNIEILVNQHPTTDDNAGTEDVSQMVFRLHNAWITNLSYTDLDATNGAILFESMQLVHEGLSVGFLTPGGNVYTSKDVVTPIDNY